LKIIMRELHSPLSKASLRHLRTRFANTLDRLPSMGRAVRDRATTLYENLPATVRATRDGAQDTTTALQTLPDSTLRWLAASSVGLGAGFYLARAPRLVILAGVAPALIMGAAIALRPIGPIERAELIVPV
jgi:hypothetical protein